MKVDVEDIGLWVRGLRWMGGRLVRKNIPLIQTIYILLLVGHGHEFAQG